jgi:hypothetical protein
MPPRDLALLYLKNSAAWGLAATAWVLWWAAT